MFSNPTFCLSDSLNKISHKTCRVGNRKGVCMFVWECMKTKGEHKGMCMEGFMFGSCCVHEESQNDMDVAASFSSDSFPSQQATLSPALNKIKSPLTKPYQATSSYRPNFLRPVAASSNSAEESFPPPKKETTLTTTKDTTTMPTKPSPPIVITPPEAPTRPTRPPKPQK